MFHRLGTRDGPVGSVDAYEVLSLDGTAREILYLSMYHPRKSNKVPNGFTYATELDPDNYIYGVNHIVEDFPQNLDAHIRKWQKEMLGIPLPVHRVREAINGSRFGLSLPIAEKNINPKIAETRGRDSVYEQPQPAPSKPRQEKLVHLPPRGLNPPQPTLKRQIPIKPSEMMKEARDAIKAGADPEMVRARLASLMLTESEQALALITSGQLDEGGELAYRAVKQDPTDWQAHYALGQFFRFSNAFPQACVTLAQAHELSPRNPPVLLALAIALQHNQDFEASVDAIKLAFEIDPEYAIAYNTLAMTQKLMGEYENAAHNYDGGAKALARVIAKLLKNAEDSPRVPYWNSRASLWTEYAISGALYLATEASIDNLTWPTGEMAEQDARTQKYKGWYWQDHLNTEQKRARLFLPNYFNTFCFKLRENSLYRDIMGNRSAVLRIMGRIEEADKHLEEAEDFSE